MSNVLVGIVGIILFIGLALASATFFGPVVTESIDEAKAGGVVRILTATSSAVVIRNREMEMISQGSNDSSVLVPNYLDDLPVNPISQAPVMMVNASLQPTSDARFVASRMGPDGEAACAYLNYVGGGSRSVPSYTGTPTRRLGCARMVSANGIFSAGEMVAFSAVE